MKYSKRETSTRNLPVSNKMGNMKLTVISITVGSLGTIP